MSKAYYCKLLLVILLLNYLSKCNSVSAQKVKLMFMGDIMGHATQLQAAYNPETGIYNFDESFKYVSKLICEADIAIANLELTLDGEPYSDFPLFSVPDAMALAIQKAGFDVLVTANNHSCDRFKRGIDRTIMVLDSLGIPHTGTYSSLTDWQRNNPLIIEKNGVKISFLNYTYGTNGIRVPKGSFVGLIDTTMMKMDIMEAKSRQPDVMVVFLHWGNEYTHQPTKIQRELVSFLKQNGVQIIIGAHPHVLQPMEWHNTGFQNYFVAYSLGNFVSGQRTKPRDGGVIAEVEIWKNGKTTQIVNTSYHLSYVHYPKINGIRRFIVVPIKQALQLDSLEVPGQQGWGRMVQYAEEARKVMQKNMNVYEK